MPNKEQPSHSGDKDIHTLLGFLRDGETNGCENCRIVTVKGIDHCLDSGCFDRQIFGD